MHLIAEFAFLCFIWMLYCLCRDRRNYLKRRIGSQALKNVYRVGRNIFSMLRRDDLAVCGDLGALNTGCILYSFHFGLWELMPYTLCRKGYKVGIITNRYHTDSVTLPARILNYLLNKWRSRGGVRVFYKESVLEIVRFLKSGGVFGMLVDGDDFYQKYGKAEKLARLCHVPIVPFAAYRDRGRGVLHVGCNIPDLVKNMPLDYVWFYKSR